VLILQRSDEAVSPHHLSIRLRQSPQLDGSADAGMCSDTSGPIGYLQKAQIKNDRLRAAGEATRA
jgi:hypothetical protein